MKRALTWLLILTCVVVSQKKTRAGYLTECQGVEVSGQVLFAEKMERGQMASYTPFIVEGDDYVYGKITMIQDVPLEPMKQAVSSKIGKEIEP